jgi:hypothetical protein
MELTEVWRRSVMFIFADASAIVPYNLVAIVPYDLVV